MGTSNFLYQATEQRTISNVQQSFKRIYSVNYAIQFALNLWNYKSFNLLQSKTNCFIDGGHFIK